MLKNFLLNALCFIILLCCGSFCVYLIFVFGYLLTQHNYLLAVGSVILIGLTAIGTVMLIEFIEDRMN